MRTIIVRYFDALGFHYRFISIRSISSQSYIPFHYTLATSSYILPPFRQLAKIPRLRITMASSTGVPGTNVADEQQPLLGDAQTTTQSSHQGLQFNFVTGTAIIAQAGIWILTALVGLQLARTIIYLLALRYGPQSSSTKLSSSTYIRFPIQQASSSSHKRFSSSNQLPLKSIRSKAHMSTQR